MIALLPCHAHAVGVLRDAAVVKTFASTTVTLNTSLCGGARPVFTYLVNAAAS